MGTSEDEPTSIARIVSRPVDLVVVDHYDLGADWERAAAPWADRAMAIDDLADRFQAVDIVLNQNLGASASRYLGLVPPRPGSSADRPSRSSVPSSPPPGHEAERGRAGSIGSSSS